MSRTLFFLQHRFGHPLRIEAIGIDQKSGIYVRDLTTGEVRLVRGKQSYLVDPRKEVHSTRTISASDGNLWNAPNEPHKIKQAAQ